MPKRASPWFSRVASLVAFLGIGGCFFVGKSALGGPPRTLAPVSTHKARIVVGPNVHASQANETFPHEECVAAADPTNPARLLIAAMYSSDKWGKAKVAGKLMQTRGVAGYYSANGGETWQRAFEYKGNPDNDFSDPAVAFGPDGSAYFVCLRAYMKAWEQHARVPIPHGGDPDSGCLEFSRSSDGGKTWGRVTCVPPLTDRPWLAVDSTLGPHRSDLYCLGDLGKSWVVLTFAKGDPAARSAKATFPRMPGMDSALSSNLALLSDGAVVWTLDQRGLDKKVRPMTTVLLSGNGGRSFREIGKANLTSDRRSIPQLTADALSTKYRDRLYYVWQETEEQARIVFSSSGDRGRTWTGPMVLSEQPTDGPGDQDYTAFMPSIAVHKEGVVAVSWYDRRGLANRPAGYNVRMRISVDGGASWLPSVQLNKQPCQGSPGYLGLGDTAGIAADADGHFHPVWIDDRTGTKQVWTATIRVET